MRITRDKLNKLAHIVADTLAEIDEGEFLEDRNTIRQEARKALEKLLTEETRNRPGSPAKDRIQRRIIPGRLAGVGHPLSEVLQRGSEEVGDLRKTLVFPPLRIFSAHPVRETPRNDPQLEEAPASSQLFAICCGVVTYRRLS